MLDKILNPMPDYDPFEKSTAAAPQFFPDAVDKRSRELLIDALTNQQESLKDHLQFLKEQDSQLREGIQHLHRLDRTCAGSGQ